MTFAELSAHPTLVRALDEKGYTQPTPVQESVFGPEFAEADLLVSAETGSGKTVAFGLAIGPTLLGERTTFASAGKALALVIAPTRELALQVQRELAWLYGAANGRVASCVGGMDIRREMQALHAGAHIVVGTPGRLVDHLERGSLKLDQLKAVVLDEADEMLDMGFREELERILSDAPKQRRTLLFSATIPAEIESLAERYQKNAKRIIATSPKQAHRDIEYRAHLIAVREREHAVVNVLRAHDAASAIIFCQTRDAVNHLHANLVERGFAAVALSGELTQAERTRALKALRDARARVLVATDVAARGLDLPDVGLVIHADLPNDSAVLQHRSGRTGRAGRKGVAVVLVQSSRRRVAERLLREAKANAVWSPPPSADQIRSLDEQRIVNEVLSQSTEVTEEDLAVARRLLTERSAEQLAAMLAAQQRAKLPAAEELPLSTEMATTPAPARFATRDRRFEPRERGGFEPQERGDRPPPRRPREGEDQGSAWFSINVGRAANADPKWLIPLICRRGKVTKADIGAIRIFPEETRIEIAASAAERFAKSAGLPDRQDPRIRIAPSAPPGAGSMRPHAGPPRRPGPRR
jgi:ATP-dependent RNA helicase DeaD